MPSGSWEPCRSSQPQSSSLLATRQVAESRKLPLLKAVPHSSCPDNLTINVGAKTADGSAITVEGCTETTLASDTKTTLNATGTRVVLKGKITELYCNGTYDSNQLLTSLNVQGLTALQKLYCSNNQLPELNVQGLNALQELGCYNNQLPELNVQGLTALKVLYCSGNKLPELNVQGLTALQVLYCSGNKLPELNVQGLTALKRLYCSNNKLPELNVQGLTALQVLYCSNNYLTVLDLQGCTSLKELDCYSNQLNAKAMTELLNALPAREESDRASAILYTEDTGEGEDNCKDYTQPEELKKAVEDAKSRNWKVLRLKNASGDRVDI